MHAIDLADLANTLTRHSTALLDHPIGGRPETLNSYWLTCRFRHEEWSSKLAAHREVINKHGAAMRLRRWHEIYPTIQEVLLAEPLARCLAYLARVLEQQEKRSELSSLSYSALLSHIEARNRCLNLIVFGQGLPVADAIRLNRLRRKMEDYCDHLLSALPPVESAEDFCHDPARLRQQQSQLRGSRSQGNELRIHTAGLSEGLWKGVHIDLDWRSQCGRHNYRISQVVLDLFSADAFDSFGVPKSVDLRQLLAESPESDGRQDDLLAPLVQPLDILLETGRRRLQYSDKRF